MSTVTDLATYQQFAQEQQAQNNAWSAEQAQKQMDFQREMSSSAHQREVADLKAAGLNPVLSANSGASVPQGASAEADTSTAGNVGAILQQVLSAQSAREVAGMYNAATIAAASIAANASMYGADMSYKNAEDHPNNLGAVGARIVNSVVGGSKGSTLFNAIKQASSTAKAAFKAHRSSPDFYSWMRKNGGVPSKLGYGSQQWILANSLFEKGQYSLLKTFLKKFR